MSVFMLFICLVVGFLFVCYFCCCFLFVCLFVCLLLCFCCCCWLFCFVVLHYYCMLLCNFEGCCRSRVRLRTLVNFVWLFHIFILFWGARCSSVVRAFAHGAMGRRIDPSWRGPIELFLVQASAPHLLSCLWDDAANRKE